MTNEIATEIDLTAVRFEPSVIEISRYDELKETVEAYADKYRGLVFEEADLKGAKEVRAEMKKFSSILDDKRKEVKSEYNKPLKEFEDKIKGLTKIVKEVVDPIDEGIKSLEERQKQERIDKVTAMAGKKLEKHSDYVKHGFEFKNEWFNKTTSQKAIREGINVTIKYLVAEEEKKQNDEAVINGYCEARKVEPEGWLLQLNNGATTAEVMAMIDKSVADKKEREQAEIERKQHEEELERIKQESYVELSEKGAEEQPEVDMSFDDLEDDPFAYLPVDEDQEPFIPEELLIEEETVKLEITGTLDQLQMLNQFFVANGMRVVPIKE